MRSVLGVNYQSDWPLKTIEALLREVVAKLPENCASIHINLKQKSAILDLSPANPNAAPIRVIVPVNEEGELTLVAGRGTFFEIPQGGHRYTELPFVEEIKSICLAVIAGTLEECVLLDGDEVLRGVGSIKLPQASTRTTVRWRRIYFRPFHKKEKKHFTYEPYCPDGLIR